ncbi:hypothetical protein CFR77_06590 [Komagataeibacter sucrofermentans]|uniref:Phage tail protein n=3 Tax=Komagataeibacter sucrofermentans TaxID=1053551 RepID=A0A318QN88_9PROT|nr:hypothetical protein CFR77_06590 [Komagataeibacter sucrofermentans]
MARWTCRMTRPSGASASSSISMAGCRAAEALRKNPNPRGRMVSVTETTNSGGDIEIVWDTANGRGDWAIENGSIARTPSGMDMLKNMVLICLFTDRVAPPDYTGTDRRGWWADTYRAQPIGSLLWTLNRSKIASRAQLLQRIRAIATDALQPLQTAGYVKSINIRVGLATSDTAAIAVSLTRPDGSTSQYSWLWQVP